MFNAKKYQCLYNNIYFMKSITFVRVNTASSFFLGTGSFEIFTHCFALSFRPRVLTGNHALYSYGIVVITKHLHIRVVTSFPKFSLVAEVLFQRILTEPLSGHTPYLHSAGTLLLVSKSKW